VCRRITAAGTIEGRLTGDGVYKILKARAAAAKLTVPDTERLSPHGLRAGMITEATLNGALDEQIMPHSRHKDSSTMRGYRRRARIVVDNPARLLDL
jgi:integrase